MSRRRRTSAAAALAPPEPPVTSLTSLPDHLLVRCLGLLAPRERLERAALVCRRFRELCLDPELLESIAVMNFTGARFLNTAEPPDRLRALLALLTTHGRHVRRLVLHADDRFGSYTRLVVGCLAAVAAAAAAGGRLERLEVSSVPVGSLLEFEGPRLPASLAHLELWDRTGTQQPQQLSQLSALSSLSLVRCPYEAASVALLSSLRSLRHLALIELPPGCLPAYLAAATRLERLEVGSHADVDSAAFSSPLRRLRHLTCLALAGERCRPASRA
ncbi:hypothetical protein ABPG75_012070 [Micractinium tetrahymenae]